MGEESSTTIADRTLSALKDSHALLEGHFILSSGLHASRYVQCAQLLQFPDMAQQVCSDLASKIKEDFHGENSINVVLGPAMGAVTFSYELARAMGVRGIFAERNSEGQFALRRGFNIQPGERVLVAEDVVTTGKSASEVIAMLAQMGVNVVAAASIVNRSGLTAPFGDTLPYFSCIDLDIPSYDPKECLTEIKRMTEEYGKPYKPGSRPSID